MANASPTTSSSPWEYSIVCRFRGGTRVELFISEMETERLRHILDEGTDEFVVFDSENARHALNGKYLLLHHLRRYPGRRVAIDERPDLSVQILFADSAKPEKIDVESDTEDAADENDHTASQFQHLFENIEMGGPRLFFRDD